MTAVGSPRRATVHKICLRKTMGDVRVSVGRGGVAGAASNRTATLFAFAEPLQREKTKTNGNCREQVLESG